MKSNISRSVSLISETTVPSNSLTAVTSRSLHTNTSIPPPEKRPLLSPEKTSLSSHTTTSHSWHTKTSLTSSTETALLSSIETSLSSPKKTSLSWPTKTSLQSRPLPVACPSRWKASGPCVLVMFLFFCLPHYSLGSVHSINCHSFDDTRFKQHCLLTQAMFRCNHTISQTVRPSDGGLYCHPTWDNVMCWTSYAPAGSRVSQPCADYVDGFNPKEQAVRYCTPNGTWEIHPDDKINTSWTNFADCRKKQSSIDPTIEENMPIITTISTIGYSISLAFLTVATVIMLGFKKLLCQRNIIHVNLFLSFSLRAVISLIRVAVLVDGLALPQDIKRSDDGSLFFTQGPHWQCKLLVTLMHYSLGANYMWIFVEGLYLHNLIFFSVFSQSKRTFRIYIMIGWLIPLLFVIIWVFLRIYEHDTLCWNTHVRDLYWILEAPNIISILVNFIFFLNIIRVLFLKIKNCNTQDPRRYRKLAKSTLVLIPLFGVYYIIFIVMDKYKDPQVVIIHMYSEMILNSFQGTVVCLLFCFMNGEVRGEIMKRWQRHRLRRQSIVSGRSSRAFSTTSFLLRDRTSVTQTQITSDISRVNSCTESPPRSPLKSHWNQNGHKCQNDAINGDRNGGGDKQFNWSDTKSLKGSDLPRVSSKVTFQLCDSDPKAVTMLPNSQLNYSQSNGVTNNDESPIAESAFKSDNQGETIHLLSDNGTKRILIEIA